MQSDIALARDFATPYFSSIFRSLTEQSDVAHISVELLRTYFNLPEVIFLRVLC